eukprot:GFYU01014024.1.p1 GENE.GFYU01014024.1~~GFYU01014024.1.p1  ORF type:complete len:273 (-),score=56.05 GFYU01014024.1:37-855(-)
MRSLLVGLSAALALFAHGECATTVVEERPFPDASIFERLSHFKDYGIPGTVNDPVNQAAIADGTCRVLGVASQHDGYSFWKNPARVKVVLDALKDTPGTDQPSHFTLHALRDVRAACLQDQDTLPKSEFTYTCRQPSSTNVFGFRMTSSSSSDERQFDVPTVAQSLQNWYRALCDKEWAASPAGDPAYQPQQMALTVGFYCMTTCECAGLNFSASALDALSEHPQEATDALCNSWSQFDSHRFVGSTTADEIAHRARATLYSTPCHCESPHF